MAAEVITLRDGNDLGRQLPPGMQTASRIGLYETPGNTPGSFLIDRKTGKQAVFTPVDEATGICLPIITSKKLPPVGKSLYNGVVVADWNHNYHPKDNLIHGSKEQIALRNCRVQWVNRHDHDLYHAEFYGPDIENFGDLLRPIIFASAGFIPNRGLKYGQRGKAQIVSVDEKTRDWLWRSKQVKIANSVTIRDALTKRALSKDFKGVSEHTIDEFLHTSDDRRRYELGAWLLRMAVDDMTYPIAPLYKRAHREHYLPVDVAKTVGKFTMSVIGGYRRKRALSALATHLAA